MKDIEEIILEFTTYISEVLPPLISTLGAEGIDEFVIGPPVSVDKRAIAVYLGTGNFSVLSTSESFTVQAQLPGIMDPIQYHSAIVRCLKGFDPSKVYALSLGFEYGGFYPGEVRDGGSSSFLIYEVTLQDSSDDCEENFFDDSP